MEGDDTKESKLKEETRRRKQWEQADDLEELDGLTVESDCRYSHPDVRIFDSFARITEFTRE